MGLGIVLFLLSGLCTLLMGVIRYDCISGPMDDTNECADSIIYYLQISSLSRTFSMLLATCSSTLLPLSSYVPIALTQ